MFSFGQRSVDLVAAVLRGRPCPPLVLAKAGHD